MIFQRLRSGITIDDREFDAIYSGRIKEISKFHFTPVEVAIKAAEYLAEKPDTKVLDVGAGAGKFCMIGSACTDAHFTGVEQRLSLFRLAVRLASRYRLPNTAFLHANITDIPFRQFDAVYCFNAFYENIFQNNPIDHTVRLDKTLYVAYTQYMKVQLENMPAGTRLATYFSFLDEIPGSYKIQSTGFDGKLKLWQKVT